jgi:uncharacterized membrane protein YeaQ/YmgE (transglycosylase-associated protein family)
VIIVGGTAGFLAGQVIRGKGFNPVGNVLLGMAGFFVGSLLFDRMGQRVCAVPSWSRSSARSCLFWVCGCFWTKISPN